MSNTNIQILRLAVPSILASITIPLVGLVDTAIVGHISDASAIGGIAIGTMLFDLLYWNFGFLRVGTSGMTAQAFGHEDRNECAKLLAQSLALAAIGTAIIWALQWLFVTAVLSCVSCSPEVELFARKYFFIRIWAAPATLALMTFRGWFIGMQDAVSPMICDIIINTVNVISSYVLAIYTPLGTLGVAHGTVIAQYVGLTIATIFMLTKYRPYILEFTHFKHVLRWSELRQLIALNGNLFIRSLCFMIVYVGFTAIAGGYGDIELAVSSILMKLFMLFSYFVDGFAYAGEALVGKLFGEHAKNNNDIHQRLNTLLKDLFGWSIGVGIVFTIIYAIGGIGNIAMMTDDADVLSASKPYIPWLIAMPIISTLAFMWDGIYVGATAGRPIRNAMIMAAIGFVITYIALYRIWGIQALYAAYFVHLIARVVYLTIGWKPVVHDFFAKKFAQSK